VNVLSLGDWFASTANDGTLLLAVPVAMVAGLVSFFSPCVVPLLPGYLSYATGLGAAEVVEGSRRRGRMLAGASLFVLGFAVIFVATGVVAGSTGRALNEYRPVITRVLGRTRNRLMLPDGRSEFPYLGEHGQIYRLTGVRVTGFQFVQHSVEEVEMKLVTNRLFTPEETEKVICMVQGNLGHPFRIRLTHCDAIPAGARGKFEEFVCLVQL